MRLFPPEIAHSFALNSLDLANLLRIKLTRVNDKEKKVKLFGLEFQNRLGIAGGLDKDGEHINSLVSLGFSFIEVGTVTPKPQKGNPKPRLFRNIKEQSLLNRMGFNNKGVDNLLKNIELSKYEENCKLAISIGKNFDTPNEKAVDDYLFCLDKVFTKADLITINISSPNTEGLRSLQLPENLVNFLSKLKERQEYLSKKYSYKPLLVKISPDLLKEELEKLLLTLKELNIDGVIATNTTTEHSDIKEAGGLSGKPLYKKSTQTIRNIRGVLGKNFPIIASGGVMDKETFKGKLEAGADLVQIYTGIIYRGPQLIQELLDLEN